MENYAENVLQRLVTDPFLILVNSPKQLLHVRNYFKNKILNHLYHFTTGSQVCSIEKRVENAMQVLLESYVQICS